MLWMLLPDGAMPLVIVGIGLALILGLVSRSAAFGLLGMVVLFALLGPIVEGVMGELPAWMSLVLLIVIGLMLLRGLAALVIGRRASDHMVGILAADLVRVVFLALLFPFRLVWRTVRAMTNGGV